jgi:hypothetical protein
LVKSPSIAMGFFVSVFGSHGAHIAGSPLLALS